MVGVQFGGFGGLFCFGLWGFFWNGVGNVLLLGFFSATERFWIESEWLLQQHLRNETYKGKYT